MAHFSINTRDPRQKFNVMLFGKIISWDMKKDIINMAETSVLSVNVLDGDGSVYICRFYGTRAEAFNKHLFKSEIFIEGKCAECMGRIIDVTTMSYR